MMMVDGEDNSPEGDVDNQPLNRTRNDDADEGATDSEIYD